MILQEPAKDVTNVKIVITQKQKRIPFLAKPDQVQAAAAEVEAVAFPEVHLMVEEVHAAGVQEVVGRYCH